MFGVMRAIKLIVIHCSAVRPGQQSSAKDIDNWHKDKGWNGIGYHYVVRRDGTVETGRHLSVVGAHVVGHNRHSIGICYEGGLDSAGVACDTRTPEQVRALRQLVERMHAYFPGAVIVGHHDLDPRKPCPCYDVVKEYWDLQPVK